MAVLLKGSEVSKSIKKDLKERVKLLNNKGIIPRIAIVRLGERADDLAYERSAVKKLTGLGIDCKVFKYEDTITQDELIGEIRKINSNDSIHGILLFLPLPKHINENLVKREISEHKDIDCISPINTAKVFSGEPGFAPCTPVAVMETLSHYNIPVEGRNVVIIGRSMVVGKPLSMLFLKENATVTICHTKTRNIKEVCKKADILVVAAGKAKIVDDSYVSPGTIVIDVGINVDENGKLCGDVDFDKMESIADMITPVPGGIGTVTTSILAKHVIMAAEQSS